MKIAYLHGQRRFDSSLFAELKAKHRRIGRIPNVRETEDSELRLVIEQLYGLHADIDRLIYLVGLLDRNRPLFYRVLISIPSHLLPIVYDPSVDKVRLKSCCNRRRHAKTKRGD
jgi:hypothetical protein